MAGSVKPTSSSSARQENTGHQPSCGAHGFLGKDSTEELAAGHVQVVFKGSKKCSADVKSPKVV